MPTLPDALTAANAKIESMLADVSKAEQSTKQLTAAECVAQIGKELRSPVTKERGAYLRSVFESLAKNNWEATSFAPLKEFNDPDQIKPETENIGTITSLTTGKPDSTFASNLTTAKKAELIAKLLTNPEAIKKSKMTDKMDDIMSMFSLNNDDLTREYDLRWKVGDLISALQTAIKLERLVDGNSTSKSVPADSVVEKAIAPDVWPSDMATAKLDPLTKKYVRDDLSWGYDNAQSSER